MNDAATKTSTGPAKKAAAKRAETPAPEPPAETVTPAAPALIYVAYKLDPDVGPGAIVDVVPFGSRKADYQASLEYSIEHGYRPAAITPGASLAKFVADKVSN